MKQLQKTQVFVLFIGTVFAWTAVYVDFDRFYAIYGTIFKVKDCNPPNPATTPCFYGAFAFLAAFAMAYHIWKNPKQANALQKRLQYLLIGGVLFAWGNLARTAYLFYTAGPGEKLSCSGVPTDNLFTTPCFFGAVLFSIAFLVSLIITRRH